MEVLINKEMLEGNLNVQSRHSCWLCGWIHRVKLHALSEQVKFLFSCFRCVVTNNYLSKSVGIELKIHFSLFKKECINYVIYHSYPPPPHSFEVQSLILYWRHPKLAFQWLSFAHIYMALSLIFSLFCALRFSFFLSYTTNFHCTLCPNTKCSRTAKESIVRQPKKMYRVLIKY